MGRRGGKMPQREEGALDIENQVRWGVSAGSYTLLPMPGSHTHRSLSGSHPSF